MGVYVTVAVPDGVSFGPIPTAITLTDPAVLIGHMTCDVRPNIHTVKVDIHEYRQGSRLSEWTPYVQAARDYSEQNLEAELKDGALYYRTTRPVNVGDELLVWYSREYARLLVIPELDACHAKEGVYCCPNCSQTFQYPYTVRAHMRFKCDQRHVLYTSQRVATGPLTSLPVHMGSSSPFAYPQLYGLGGDNHGGSQQCSPASSVESVASSSETVAHSSPDKRKLHSVDWANRDIKRPYLDGSGSPPRPQSPNMDRAAKVDLNRNLRPSLDDEDTGGSAFRKVEKHSTTSFQRVMAPPVASISSHYEMSAGRPLAASLGQQFMVKPGMSSDEKNALATLATIYNRHPLGLVGPANLGAYIPNWNLLAATDPNRSNLKANTLKAGDDLTSDIHNIENSNPHLKLSVEYGGSGGAGRISNILPYYRSQNPMVEKIIHSALQGSLTSLSVTQNWCAKCNANFRMTSDLVYHMRSHHSPEHDHHLKKKRDEKLKCNVCGETFRERHHLTRHMTSHQDV